MLKKLPGRFTLIMAAKRKTNLAKNVSFSRNFGIRIPKHPFTKIIQKSGLPFVTTSANIHGKPVITQFKGFPANLKKVDYFIDGGKLGGKASTVVDLTKKKPVVLRK